jgi:broad specificity phosphatase PhoE
MKSISRYFLAAFALLCATTTGALAQSADIKALSAQLKHGGYVIVFRHGATNRDQADTDPLNYDNVARQRLLSERGREVARQVGEAFKTLGIPIGAIYTSKYNRAVETGKLIGGGEALPTVDLTEGGLVATPIENDRRTEALRKMVATAPAAGKNTLLVTHKPNIVDAFGKDWFEVKEGEASIFQPTTAGKANLVARVQAADWLAAVK